MTRLSLPLIATGLIFLSVALFLPEMAGLLAIQTTIVTANPTQAVVILGNVQNPTGGFTDDGQVATLRWNPGVDTPVVDYSGYSPSVAGTVAKVEVAARHQEFDAGSGGAYVSSVEVALCQPEPPCSAANFAQRCNIPLSFSAPVLSYWCDITARRTIWDAAAFNSITLRYIVHIGGFSVDDAYGVLDWLPVRVTYSSLNQDPIAQFTFTPSPATANQSVSFDASLSDDPDGSIVQYKWNFGDNTPDVTSSTGTPIPHVFTRSGNFTTSLTVTDNQGATAFSTATINVLNPSQPPPPPPSPPPTVSFTWTATELSVSFTSSVSGGTPPYTYLWVFGTVTTSTNQTALVTYTAPGSYNVTLTVTDSTGSRGAAKATVTVNYNDTGTGQSTSVTNTDTGVSGDSQSGSAPGQPIDFLTGLRILIGTVGTGLLGFGIVLRRRDG